MEGMKGAVTDGKGNVRIERIPKPVPGQYECLCRIEACASCTGTDIKIISGQMSWATPDRYPAVLGHESVGRVISVGEKVRNIKIGDRFLRPGAWYPGEYREGIFSMMGGFAEFGVVTDTAALLEDHPETQLNSYMKFQQPLPGEEEISSVDATMLVTLKEVYSYIAGLGISSNHTIAVMGAGAVAMGMCFFAKLAGAKVIAAARREESLLLCYKAGADFLIHTEKEDLASALKKIAPGGVDFLLDGAGSSELLVKGSSALKDQGAICSYASGMNCGDLWNRITPPGSWKYIRQILHEDKVHEHFLALIRMKVLPYSLFYSHVMKLSSVGEGFELLRNKKGSKIVFTMD